MLVLSRKVGEKIRLSGGITIQVVRIKGTAVRLGIEAPAEVIVLREELEEIDSPTITEDAPSPPATVRKPTVAPRKRKAASRKR